jgi:N-acetylglucosaminyldiphosphoundecaprenol N-acetyl-beta-D-mannosaminyltransferase
MEVRMSQGSSLQIAFVGGIPTTVCTLEQLADTMVDGCAQTPYVASLPKLVFSSNGQAVSMAAYSVEFRTALLSADIIHADGMSIIAASKLFSNRALPERVATSDFFHVAARRGAQAELRFFLLGATEEVNRRAYDASRRLYPRVHWVGRRNGYFPIEQEPEVCEEIRASGANVVWVGLGRPRQEEFAVRNRHRLGGVGWLKTCGGLMDFLADEKSRAPGWMQHLGIEWIFRLIQEPLRLGPRYAFTNVHAIWQFLKCGPYPLTGSAVGRVEQ